MTHPTQSQLDAAFDAYIEATKTWTIKPRGSSWFLTDWFKPITLIPFDGCPMSPDESVVMIPFETEDAAKVARLRMILRDTLAAVANHPVKEQADTPQETTNSPGERG